MKSNITNNSLLMIISILLSSCAIAPSGPTDAQRLAWANESEANTDVIVNFFVDEIWNKPVWNLTAPTMKKGTKRIWLGKNRIYSRMDIAEVTINNSYAVPPEFSPECNPELNPEKNNPILRAAVYKDIRPGNYYREGRMLNMQIGYDFRWTKKVISPASVWVESKCGRGSYHLVFPSNDYFLSNPSMREGYYLRTLSASAFRNKLVEKGVPLLYCFEDNSEDLNSLMCSIDWYATGTETNLGDGRVIREQLDPSFKIVTYGNRLLYFAVKELNISEADESLSLAEIYYHRLTDTKKTYHNGATYSEMVKDFNNAILDQINDGREYAARIQAEKDASNAAYHLAIQAKFDAMDSEVVADEPYNPYKQVQDDKILNVYKQAMSNIRSLENNALQQKQSNSRQDIKPSSTPTAIYPNRTATLISAPADPLDAEKQNCINAGKKWQADGGCDYSSSVTIQGWSQDKATEFATSNNSQNSPSATGSVSASAMSEIQNTTRDQSQLSSQAATSNSTSSGTSEDQSRLTMIVVREESYNSWSTQEVACDYAKSQVIRRAKKQCEDDYKGEPATQADVPNPIDANCQSYRQMTKSNIGEWVATGNVTFYCRH